MDGLKVFDFQIWNWILAVALAIAIVLLLIAATTPEKPTPLCSPAQFQHYLNELDKSLPPITEDGKLGRATQERWDRLYCEQQAIESILKARGKK